MDARELIDELHQRFGVCGDEIRKEYQRALDILSAELYNNDSHFLLEFVQNADDNEYPPGVIPAFITTLRDNKVTIECNETGFTEANVRAICTISNSTKQNSAECIGEKGIGFKSVFKVADVVSIESRGFKFRFDKRLNLGMVCPIWESEDEGGDVGLEAYCHGGLNPTRRDGHWTRFHLTLCGEKRKHLELKTKFKNIDPTILLFLKKLKMMSVDVGEGERWTVHRNDSNGSLGEGSASKVTLSVTREEEMVTAAEAAKVADLNYIMMSNEVHGLPKEDKRLGMSKSTITLAFPVNTDNAPRERKEKVHVFLPIRDYGFKFVVQADFLTPANRGDILDNQWNRALRDGVLDTFINAVDSVLRFIPELEFSWLSYIPKETIGFFRTVPQEIMSRLKEARFLQDITGDYGTLARHLFFIPDVMVRANGDLVLDLPIKLLSPGYLIDDPHSKKKDILRSLGVQEITWDLVYKALLKLSTAELTQKDGVWYEDLSKCLLHFQSKPNWEANLKNGNMKIVPTTTPGEWVSAVSGVCIEAKDGSNLKVPDDLKIHVAAPKATSTTYARQLLNALGVPNLTQHSIINTILTHHSRLHVGENRPEGSRLVEHARFLYQFAGKERDDQDKVRAKFLLLDHKGKLRRGRDIYMDIPNSKGRLGIKELFANVPDINILASEYFDGMDLKKPWIQWLKSFLALPTRPRLEFNGNLSPEFIKLSQTLPTPKLLQFLKENWNHYDKTKTLTPQIRKQLEELRVDVKSGARVMLKETCVPTASLNDNRWQNVVPMHFLDIDLHVNKSDYWDFLSNLHVKTKDDIEFYLEILRVLSKEKARVGSTEETVKAVYIHLAQRFSDNPEAIRKAFKKEPLFYGLKTWRDFRSVVWQGFRTQLSSKLVLSTIYPSLKEFFYEKLGVRDGDIRTLVDEIIRLSKCGKANKLSKGQAKETWEIILEMADQYSKEDRAVFDTCVRQLLRIKMFPVILGKRRLLCKRDDIIYIPDTEVMEEHCKGDPNLLICDITPLDASRVEPVFEALGMKPAQYYLSKVVRTVCLPSYSQVDTVLQKRIRGRARHLARYAYHINYTMQIKSLRILFSKLKSIEIYRTYKINHKLTIPDTTWNKTITDSVSGSTDNADEGLRIYISDSRDNNGQKTTRKPRIYFELAKYLSIEVEAVNLCFCDDLTEVEYYLQKKFVKDLPEGIDLDPDDSESGESEVEKKEEEDELIIDLAESVVEDVKLPLRPPAQAVSVPKQQKQQVTPLFNGQQYTDRVGAEPFAEPPPTTVSWQEKVLSEWDDFSRGPRLSSSSSGRTGGRTGGLPPGTYTGTGQNTVDEEFPGRSACSQRHCQAPGFIERNQSGPSSSSQNNWDFPSPMAETREIPSSIPHYDYGPEASSGDVDSYIGGLGELYVYRYLITHFPNFTSDNWTSELRGPATKALLPPFTVQSNADFEYFDHDGAMTTYIFGQSQTESWAGQWPIYLIEVKTTINAVAETPFHLSQAQLDNAVQFRPTTPPSTHVFIILRVADIHSSNPTILKITDVATMVQTQQLFLHTTKGYTCSWESFRPTYTWT
ncbi:hypothetical protein DFH27DRAFT_656493 [Peziza echinospora]|nr:hypothetical protein DFH27DRAFT_656493 [Peziza echinospora]